MSDTLKFDVGAQWEAIPWEIQFNVDVSYNRLGPCPHCIEDRMVTTERYDKSTFDTRHWTCPRVVVAWNEAGCNSTGVCLDCILEQVKKLTG